MHSLPDYLEDLKERLLSERSTTTAWKIVDEYFLFMKPERIKEELWVLTKGAITNDLLESSRKGSDRFNLIFGYEFMMLFVDAVKVLHEAAEHTEQNSRNSREITHQGNRGSH